MSNPRKYSYKFLWAIGCVLAVMTMLAVPWSVVFITTIANFFDVPLERIDEYHFFVSVFFILNVGFLVYIFVVNTWRDWAVRKVKPNELHLLEASLNDPINSMMVKRSWELNWKDRLIRAGLIILFFITCVIGDYLTNRKKYELDNYAAYTSVTIKGVYYDHHNKSNYCRAAYKFEVDGTLYQGEKVLVSGLILDVSEANGFKIDEGDQFQIKYNRLDPMHNKIDVFAPLAKTKEKYMQATIDKIETLNPTIDANCLAVGSYEKYGLKGIAVLYNQDQTYWKNGNFNRYKYKAWEIRDKFKEIKTLCKN